MKKALLTAALATLTFATANAGSINLELRGDMMSVDQNTDAGNADSYKFYLQTGRVDFKGTLMEGLDYRLRWRFNTAPTAAAREGTTNANDFAYITHKVSDMFSLTFGKQGTEVGGFEGNTSGSDLYFSSVFYGGHALDGATKKTTGYAGDIYATGVKATANFGDHKLSLGAYNNEKDVTPQNKGMTGVVYTGEMMDKALKLNISQLIAPYNTLNSTATSDDKTTYTTVGVGYGMGDWALTFDYNMDQVKGKSGTNDETYDLTGFVFNFKYMMGNWTPMFKYASGASKYSVTGAADVKGTFADMGLAAEYKPASDKNFRYHVAYNNKTWKADAGTTSPAQAELIAGFKIYTDFLK